MLKDFDSQLEGAAVGNCCGSKSFWPLLMNAGTNPFVGGTRLNLSLHLLFCGLLRSPLTGSWACAWHLQLQATRSQAASARYVLYGQYPSIADNDSSTEKKWIKLGCYWIKWTSPGKSLIVWQLLRIKIAEYVRENNDAFNYFRESHLSELWGIKSMKGHEPLSIACEINLAWRPAIFEIRKSCSWRCTGIIAHLSQPYTQLYKRSWANHGPGVG